MGMSRNIRVVGDPREQYLGCSVMFKGKLETLGAGRPRGLCRCD